MTKEQVERINALARKSRAEGLTDAEKEEQLALRRQYIEEFRANVIQTLDNTYIQEPDGTKRKLEKKDLPLAPGVRDKCETEPEQNASRQN
mgnify:CR=1 FL=1